MSRKASKYCVFADSTSKCYDFIGVIKVKLFVLFLTCFLLMYFTQQFPEFILVVRDSFNSSCCLDISAILIFVCLAIA